MPGLSWDVVCGAASASGELSSGGTSELAGDDAPPGVGGAAPDVGLAVAESADGTSCDIRHNPQSAEISMLDGTNAKQAKRTSGL